MGGLKTDVRSAERTGSVVRLTPSRVATLLRQRIETEGVAPGDKFLSVREIAANYGISAGTAHQVVKTLADQGIIETRPRSGTIIKSTSTLPADGGRRTRAVVHVLVGRPDLPSQSIISYSMCDGLLECWPGVSAQINVLPEQDIADYLDDLLAHGHGRPEVVGVVLVRCPHEVKQYFTERRMPVVVWGHVDEELDLAFVDRDQYALGKTVANYLLDRGHCCLGMLMHNQWLPGDNLFLAGMQAATSDRGLTTDHLMIRCVPTEPQSVRASLQAMRSQRACVTAVVCRADPLAVECLAAAKQMGLRVPADLAIVSVGEDSRLLQATDPPITSMSRDGREIGRLTGELLKSIRCGQPVERQHVELPSVLIERQST